MTYHANGKICERQINYIPLRYIFSIILTFLETFAIIAIIVIICIFFPYFYIAVLLTQIGVVIYILGSEDNPDYKIPWLLFVIILPIAGFMLHFLFAKRKLNNKYIKRLKAVF